jgi:peptidoglycan/LPS O-acetylase OafA/YrhL
MASTRPSPSAPITSFTSLEHTKAVGADVRIPSVDGLRGMAILLVLLLHFTIYGVDRPSGGVLKFVYKTLETGWIGVDLFFVLSGFLITGILYRTKAREHYFSRFYLRRTLRIFPLYFGVLVIATVVLPRVFADNVRFNGWREQGIWYWTYTANVMVARHGWNLAPVQGLDHFWSLAIEEQFYLVWPLCVYLLDRQRLLLLCGLTMAASLGVRLAINLLGHPLAAYVLTPARLDALAVGAIVALLAADERGLSPLRGLAWRVAVLSALVFAAIAAYRFTTNPNDLVIQTLGYSVIAIMFGAGLVITLSDGRTNVARWLSTRPLRLLGRYSYGLYVFHHPVLFVLPPANVALALQQTLGISLLARPLAIALVASLCLAMAASSWHLFEQPILNLRERSRRRPRGARPLRVSSDRAVLERLDARPHDEATSVQQAAARIDPAGGIAQKLY